MFENLQNILKNKDSVVVISASILVCLIGVFIGNNLHNDDDEDKQDVVSEIIKENEPDASEIEKIDDLKVDNDIGIGIDNSDKDNINLEMDESEMVKPEMDESEMVEPEMVEPKNDNNDTGKGINNDLIGSNDLIGNNEVNQSVNSLPPSIAFGNVEKSFVSPENPSLNSVTSNNLEQPISTIEQPISTIEQPISTIEPTPSSNLEPIRTLEPSSTLEQPAPQKPIILDERGGKNRSKKNRKNKKSKNSRKHRK